LFSRLPNLRGRREPLLAGMTADNALAVGLIQPERELDPYDGGHHTIREAERIARATARAKEEGPLDRYRTGQLASWLDLPLAVKRLPTAGQPTLRPAVGIDFSPDGHQAALGVIRADKV
jgi:hypothetical protein